jgi:hypothetical protein
MASESINNERRHTNLNHLPKTRIHPTEEENRTARLRTASKRNNKGGNKNKEHNKHSEMYYYYEGRQEMAIKIQNYLKTYYE